MHRGTLEESSEWCVILPHGTDTNGDEWYQCTVHGYLVFGDAYVCEGYKAPAYQEFDKQGPM